MSVLATILATAEAGAEHAAEHEEKSELPFFVIGGLLAAFAVSISVVGYKRPDFPSSEGAARGVMVFSVTIVLATMITIVYVSS
jgi:hypothetical protein